MSRTITRSTLPWIIGTVLVIVAIIAGTAAVILGIPRVDPGAARAELRSLTTVTRAAMAAPPVATNADLDAVAQQRAEQLADAGGTPQHDATLSQRLPHGWWSYAENIAGARGATPSAMHATWAASEPANISITGAGFTDAGFGFATAADGTSYGVELFATYVHPPAAATISSSAPGGAFLTAQTRASASPAPTPVASETFVSRNSYLVLFGAIGALVLAATSGVLFVLFGRRRSMSRRASRDGGATVGE